ncbi:hypothetical protein [Saccharothrix sp. HUAS TT1]|uniref:hypothetical protein n=1 Tax=unclassified Saccharothrix TaxID=2593673 RepID=UPI00345B603F
MPSAADLRAALDRIRNTSGAERQRAVSDAARLGIDVTREVTAESDRDTGKTFSDRYEADLRGRMRRA